MDVKNLDRAGITASNHAVLKVKEHKEVDIVDFSRIGLFYKAGGSAQTGACAQMEMSVMT